MTRTIHCPKCKVELTIPKEAGTKRLRCPKCAERFYPSQQASATIPASPSAPNKKSKPAPTSAPDKSTKKSKVPPSSSQPPPARANEPKPPTTLPELRDMIDIPLLGDDFPHKSSGQADAAALFGDDPVPEKRKKSAAEAKRQARRCTTCGRVVLQGMSLCDNCGLDQDTGMRYEVAVEEEDEEPEEED